MGKYRSDDSDEDRDSMRKHKKKSKKRRGRSRSGSDSENSHMSSSRGKKSKKRSPSNDRYHGSSRRGRRSRSRSRSKSPSSRRGRYSRSPYRSRSRSPSARKSRRSRSRSRPRGQRKRSRSYSREKYSGSEGRSQSRRSSPISKDEARADTKRTIPSEHASLSSLTPAQQAEERMRLALKAAAAADQKLRQLPLTESDIGDGASAAMAMEGGQPRFSSYEESQSFADSVAAISSGNFKQAVFKSSRCGKPQDTPSLDVGPSHDDAIFGSLAVTGFTIKPDPDTKPLQMDPESIMHQSLFCDPEDKLDRWIERLSQLRRRKLEGDAL